MDFLKRLDDYESPMPVIFMTGDREQIPYKENQNRNLFGILEKPFTIESVAEILQQTLDKIYNFSTK
jgi:DNA-binding NtrC family response regulator